MKNIAIIVLATWLPIAVMGESSDIAEYSSGSQRVSLVELYTSEGCSSCPPADRWLSSLVEDKRLWLDFVPVALHVDYWDYIGWSDRFASPQFTDRQRRYAYESEKPVIYTPGMFVDGQEWLDWRRNERPPRTNSPAGDLSVRLIGDIAEVRFANGTLPDQSLVLHLGLLGMNLETQVKAGENRGRRLTHDFVLLRLDSTTLEAAADRQSATARLSLVSTNPAARAFVAWVSFEDSQAPIQVVGGYLPAD